MLQAIQAHARRIHRILHYLCHTFASFALRQGESVLVIGRLLGHSDPQTTLKYTHLADAMVREAVEAVGAALEG